MSYSEGEEPESGIQLGVSDQSQFASLHDWLREQPGVKVAVTSRAPKRGELGALDVLAILGGGTGAIAAVRTLPAFIRSRRSGLRIETTVRGQPFVLDATNVDDVMLILERLLDDE